MVRIVLNKGGSGYIVWYNLNVFVDIGFLEGIFIFILFYIDMVFGYDGGIIIYFIYLRYMEFIIWN